MTLRMWCRLGIRLMGVWLMIAGVTNALLIVGLFAGIWQFVVGLFLVLAGELVVRYLFPISPRYCARCGASFLWGSGPECFECGEVNEARAAQDDPDAS